MSLNRVVLTGRLVRDPELRYTGNQGVAVSNFTIAANRPFKNEQGESEADFIQCVAWRKQAENLANYMKKGNMIGVDGRIQTRSYEGQDGKMIYVTEVLAENIQFLEPRKSDNGPSAPQGYQQNNQQYQQSQPQAQQSNPFEQQGQAVDIGSDDLPF